MNILIKAGVTVTRATAPFTAGGKQYPAGSYVVKTAQPFRAARDGHVRAAGSSERHPVSRAARRRPPYDATGYNLAYRWA